MFKIIERVRKLIEGEQYGANLLQRLIASASTTPDGYRIVANDSALFPADVAIDGIALERVHFDQVCIESHLKSLEVVNTRFHRSTLDTTLECCRFKDCHFDESLFFGHLIQCSVFNGSSFLGAQFQGSLFNVSVFTDCIFDGVKFIGPRATSHIVKEQVSDEVLEEIGMKRPGMLGWNKVPQLTFRRCRFLNTTFRNALMDRVRFDDCNPNGLLFTDSDTSKAEGTTDLSSFESVDCYPKFLQKVIDCLKESKRCTSSTVSLIERYLAEYEYGRSLRKSVTSIISEHVSDGERIELQGLIAELELTYPFK